MPCPIPSLGPCCAPIASGLTAAAEFTGLPALAAAIAAVVSPILTGSGGAVAAFAALSIGLKIGVVVVLGAAIGLTVFAVAKAVQFCYERAKAGKGEEVEGGGEGVEREEVEGGGEGVEREEVGEGQGVDAKTESEEEDGLKVDSSSSDDDQ